MLNPSWGGDGKPWVFKDQERRAAEEGDDIYDYDKDNCISKRLPYDSGERPHDDGVIRAAHDGKQWKQEASSFKEVVRC